jgi:hypothetical protein
MLSKHTHKTHRDTFKRKSRAAETGTVLIIQLHLRDANCRDPWNWKSFEGSETLKAACLPALNSGLQEAGYPVVSEQDFQVTLPIPGESSSVCLLELPLEL